MKVAVVVPSLGLLEGQGRADLEIVRRVAGAGHTVEVFTMSAPDVVREIFGVRIRKLPRLPTWQFGNQLMALSVTGASVRRARYDIVHADAGMLPGSADVVVVHTVTGRWLRLPEEIWREPGVRGANQAIATRFKARLEVRQARAARAVIANSAATAADLAAAGVDPANISVAPFGVDAAWYRPPTPDERASARTRFAIPPDAFVPVMVGSHGPRKGLPEALDAIGDGEHLLVAGQHRGGRWVADARARGLRVAMPGKLDDVRHAYWAADVLLYPSRYDAFGMAVLEAMSCGLPVLVSRAAGAHEIVGEAGLLLDEVSPASIRAGLDAIRTADRASMGAAARAIAEGRPWDAAAAVVLEVYERLAGERA